MYAFFLFVNLFIIYNHILWLYMIKTINFTAYSTSFNVIYLKKSFFFVFSLGKVQIFSFYSILIIDYD